MHDGESVIEKIPILLHPVIQ